MISQTENNVVPVFFATDDNYAPFLAVALNSLLKNASSTNLYKIYVLTTNLALEHQEKISQVVQKSGKNVSIEFVSLKDKMEQMKSMFHLRDYYSIETYYRFFIPDLFPEYDKVLYLDCDIVVLKDIAELYNTDITQNLVGAAVEEVMTEYDWAGNYVEKALGVDRNTYFNAGILLMNAAEFRKQRIASQFINILQRFTFRVTQDEDYLNVICKDKTVLLDLGWNKTAFKNKKFDDSHLNLVHYKISWKPWHYSGIEYEDYFWNYAQETAYIDELREMLKNYSDKDKARDEAMFKNLVKMCGEDSKDPNSYRAIMERESKKQNIFVKTALSLIKFVNFRNFLRFKKKEA